MTVIAHPAKPMRDRKGQYPRVSMYDIAGSAHWNNLADIGISIWRDLSVAINTQMDTEERRLVEISILKMRARQHGHIGIAQVNYVPEYAGYEDIPEIVIEKDKDEKSKQPEIPVSVSQIHSALTFISKYK
jgi:hypothetical protein